MSDRELFEGGVGIYWLPDADAPTAIGGITQTEAGDLVDILGTHGAEAAFDGSGWAPSVSAVTDEDWAGKDQISIDSTVSLGVASIRFKWHEDTHPIYTLHVDGSLGWVVFAMDNATTTGAVYEYYRAKMSTKHFDPARGAKAWTGHWSLISHGHGAFAADP